MADVIRYPALRCPDFPQTRAFALCPRPFTPLARVIYHKLIFASISYIISKMDLNQYINSIKGKRIAVIGIGISNEPLIRLLCAGGCDVTACDRRTFEELGEKALELIDLGAKLKLGEAYLEGINADIVFRTPGLMPFDNHLEVARKNGAEITSEMELFFKMCPCKIFAVTGSDGKTTTTTIISELLKAQGYKVHLGGNIGKPLLCETALMSSEDFAVLELSSFQLHSMTCSPDVAVITNISPNHLDKHKDYQDYIDAKKQIFLNMKENGVLVLNADDEIVSTFPGQRFFSIEKEVDGAFCLDGIVYRGGRKLMSADEIYLPGEHNIKNFMAAFAATLGYVDDDVCINVAKEFKGVEHRLETVRTLNGITFVNDSIGSSPSRTIAGLRAMRKPPVLILGGYDKKIPFDALGEEVVKLAKKAVITGATADKIKAAIDRAGVFEYYMTEDFDEAVKKAYDVSEEGDIVLFSPACASFDHFKNFEERGKHFKNLVAELT